MLNLFAAKHASWALPREMKSVYIIKKKWISKSSKYFQSSWKMTLEGCFFQTKTFTSTETTFHLPIYEKNM